MALEAQTGYENPDIKVPVDFQNTWKVLQALDESNSSGEIPDEQKVQNAIQKAETQNIVPYDENGHINGSDCAKAIKIILGEGISRLDGAFKVAIDKIFGQGNMDRDGSSFARSNFTLHLNDGTKIFRSGRLTVEIYYNNGVKEYFTEDGEIINIFSFDTGKNILEEINAKNIVPYDENGRINASDWEKAIEIINYNMRWRQSSAGLFTDEEAWKCAFDKILAKGQGNRVNKDGAPMDFNQWEYKLDDGTVLDYNDGTLKVTYPSGAAEG